MKIFVFKFNNYYSGDRNFKILANSRDEAWNILEKECNKYVNDECSFFVDETIIEIDSPKFISKY